MSLLRVYDRYLRTSEAVGNYQADAAVPALVVQSRDRPPEETTPWSSLRRLMSDKVDPQAHMTVGIAELKPGKSSPWHIHDNCEEAIYILSGSCEQRVDKQTVVLKAGDTLRIPASRRHTARAVGTEPMRAFVAYNAGDRHFKAVEGKSQPEQVGQARAEGQGKIFLRWVDAPPARRAEEKEDPDQV